MIFKDYDIHTESTIEYIFLYEINQSFDFIYETDLVRTDINADNELNIMDVVLLVYIILGD